MGTPGERDSLFLLAMPSVCDDPGTAAPHEAAPNAAPHAIVAPDTARVRRSGYFALAWCVLGWLALQAQFAVPAALGRSLDDLFQPLLILAVVPQVVALYLGGSVATRAGIRRMDLPALEGLIAVVWSISMAYLLGLALIVSLVCVDNRVWK